MSVTYVPAELRRIVRERAGERCEYCLIPQLLTLKSHQVDHVIAEKHGGATTPENLCLACVLCNQRKGTDVATIHLPTQTLVMLFNPRRDEWNEHFRLRDGLIEGRTLMGEVTAEFLQFNSPDRVKERISIAE